MSTPPWCRGCTADSAWTSAALLTIEDLKSTNGTSVNGRTVTRAVLVPGDRLRVGRVEFSVIREADEPA